MTRDERELLVGLARFVLLDPEADAGVVNERLQERWRLARLMADVEKDEGVSDDPV